MNRTGRDPLAAERLSRRGAWLVRVTGLCSNGFTARPFLGAHLSQPASSSGSAAAGPRRGRLFPSPFPPSGRRAARGACPPFLGWPPFWPAPPASPPRPRPAARPRRLPIARGIPTARQVFRPRRPGGPARQLLFRLGTSAKHGPTFRAAAVPSHPVPATRLPSLSWSPPFLLLPSAESSGRGSRGSSVSVSAPGFRHAWRSRGNAVCRGRLRYLRLLFAFHRDEGRRPFKGPPTWLRARRRV